MTKAVDDLRVGWWVAVTRSVETVINSYGQEVEVPGRLVSGLPLKIKAISLPFIVVTTGHLRFPLDVRRCEFERLSTEYVRALKGDLFHVCPDEIAKSSPGDYSLSLHRSQSVDGRLCPVCGQQISLHKARSKGRVVKSLACKFCGFHGRMPQES